MKLKRRIVSQNSLGIFSLGFYSQTYGLGFRRRSLKKEWLTKSRRRLIFPKSFPF
ncbi:hypothetical protein LEP1GSC043_2057 [Leptospira weilii str. Ecochallenge]|uniref:Uncharacterized protein n=1 Tax=Leptospira weilii str. Ecochallenge TaxID=1049986 RepID=N1UBY7_9LEPT|nr:hypothetical protein LEP1GSC043_2057 [Leptospira weilii str. Ecochallenge]